MSQDMKELFTRLTHGLSAEDVMLDTMQSQIAAEISMKRQELDMTQKQLAELMGVSQATVSKWESSDANFQLSTLVKIASRLGLQLQCPFAASRQAAYEQPRSNIYRLSIKNDWHGNSSLRQVYPCVNYAESKHKEA